MSTTNPGTTARGKSKNQSRQSRLGEDNLPEFEFTVSREDVPECDEEGVEMTPCLRVDDSDSVTRVTMHTCPICGKDPADADGSVPQHFERRDHNFAALTGRSTYGRGD